MISAKGKELKIIDEHRFKKDRIIIDGQRWRCTNKVCKVAMVTDLLGENLVRAPTDVHNHPPVAKLERNFMKFIKRKATEDISSRPTKIVSREILPAPWNLLTSDVLLSRPQTANFDFDHSAGYSNWSEYPAEYPTVPSTIHTGMCTIFFPLVMNLRKIVIKFIISLDELF